MSYLTHIFWGVTKVFILLFIIKELGTQDQSAEGWVIMRHYSQTKFSDFNQKKRYVPYFTFFKVWLRLANHFTSSWHSLVVRSEGGLLMRDTTLSYIDVIVAMSALTCQTSCTSLSLWGGGKLDVVVLSYFTNLRMVFRKFSFLAFT